MDKQLLTYEVESNDETITIDVEQTDKGININIVGQTVDISVNGEIVFSKYDKEEYKYIPAFLRPFIEKNLSSWGDGLRKENENEVRADLEIGGIEFLAILPINKAKNNKMLLRDWIIDYSLLESNLNIKVDNGNENFEDFKKAIKKAGCEIEFSHDGNDYDNWYNLVVPIDESITEEFIMGCIKLWDSYNQNLITKHLNGVY